MTIESGTQFGSYTIEGSIAGGGMGQVYAARHNVYGSVVALKVLHKQLHADAEWRLRFNLEGVIGQQLKHPHVVAARELIEQDDHVGIVLDLVSGGLTLHRCISREYNSGVSIDQALRVFLAIVQGVEYAHGKMVTHGDIKPENVLLEGAYRDPSTWNPKVTDFGTVGIMAHPVMIDGRPAVVVSPRYAAPEHLLGIDKLEPRTDIYCLGLLLHYLLTGVHASTARTVEEAAVITAKPLSMVALVDQPEPVREIVLRACQREIEDRFQTCGEIAVAIRSAMDALGLVFEVEDIAADLATEMMPERDAMRRADRDAAVSIDDVTLDSGEPLSTGAAEDGLPTELLGPDDLDPAVAAAGRFAAEQQDGDDAAGDGTSPPADSAGDDPPSAQAPSDDVPPGPPAEGSSAGATEDTPVDGATSAEAEQGNDAGAEAIADEPPVAEAPSSVASDGPSDDAGSAGDAAPSDDAGSAGDAAPSDDPGSAGDAAPSDDAAGDPSDGDDGDAPASAVEAALAESSGTDTFDGTFFSGEPAEVSGGAELGSEPDEALEPSASAEAGSSVLGIVAAVFGLVLVIIFAVMAIS